MRKTIVAALLASAPAAAQPDASAEPERIVEVGTTPRWGESDDWFDLPGTSMRMLVPDGPERETIWDLLVAADRRGVALRFRFDATAGRLNAEGSRVTYPLCSVAAASGARFGDEARNCPRRSPAAAEAERLLAIGVAEVYRDPERARATLGRALATRPALSLRGEGLALRARGQSAQVLAEATEPGEARDGLLAEALADFRRLAALAPDRIAPQFDVALTLMMLGAYEEAHAIYEAALRRWPDHDFDLNVAIATLYRQQGDYRRALRQLDDYAQGVDRSQFGMQFYYHRSWTLSLLRRNEEALADIDRGLAAQPDYSSAYMLRSCLQARLGRLNEALADQERALELHAAMRGAPVAETVRMIEQSRGAAAALRAAIASGRRDSSDIGCGFWDRWSRPRPRSPLLAARPQAQP